MRDEREHDVTQEYTSEAQDSPQPEESPRSMLFLLPGMIGAAKGSGEDVWRDLVTTLNGLSIRAEILLFKSTATGKTKHMPLTTLLVVNVDGVDPPELLRTLQAFHSVFSQQMSLRHPRSSSPESRPGSQTPWAYSESTEALDDVVQDAIENCRRAFQAGLTRLDRVVWCRMRKAGTVERALIDLSKDPGRVQFRAVNDKKRRHRKAPARSRAKSRTRNAAQKRKTVMDNKDKEKKLSHDTEAPRAEVGRAPIYQVPSTTEEFIAYCVRGASWMKMNRHRSKDAARADQSCDSTKPVEG